MKSKLMIVLAFFLWSTTAVLLRQAGLSVANFVVAANLLGIVLLLAVCPRTVGSLVRLPRRPILWMGIMGAVNVFASFSAFLHTSIGNVLILHYTAPVLVALAAPMVLHERPSTRTWEALALSLVGLIAVGWDGLSFGGAEDLIGIVLALVSGAAYAVVILASRAIAKSGADPVAVTVAQSLFLPVFALPFTTMGAYTTRGVMIAFLAGALHLSLAAVLYVRGLKGVTASTGGIIGYTEIFFGMLWGRLAYAEPISAAKIFGGVMIVAAGLLVFHEQERVVPKLG